MHGAVPLLRTVTGTVNQAYSRIPHLTVHILRRQARSKLALAETRLQLKQQTRWQNTASTYSLHDVSIAAVKNEGDNVFDDNGWHSQTTANSQIKQPQAQDSIPVQKNDSFPTINAIIQEGNPDRLLIALGSKSVGSAFVSEANDEVFESAFCLLDPDHFIEPLKHAYRHMFASSEADLISPSVPSIEHYFRAFTERIDDIVSAREQAGRKLTVGIYRHLLKYASSIGDGEGAARIFQESMPRDKVTPDLACYNYYMQALNWNLAYNKTQQFSLRVLPQRMEKRASKLPPPYLRGYTTRYDADIAASALRAKALAVFKRISAQQLVGNEHTFTNIMIAMAREGDIEGVKSVLKSVWNVNLDMLKTYDEEEIESPTFYDNGHPLHPSERLLFTVVHCFSINNDLGSAWSLMDYISRNYDLTIPLSVWTHLYEWTFVLSSPQSSTRKKQGHTTGQLPANELENLHTTIIDAPYNIVPEALMSNLRARRWRQRKHLDNTVSCTQETEAMLQKAEEKLHDLGDDLIARLQDTSYNLAPAGILASDFLNTCHQFRLQFLEVALQRMLMTRQVQNILREKDFAGSGKQTTWTRQKLPRLLEEFIPYVANEVTYSTRTGVVELSAKVHRIEALWNRHQDKASKMALLYRAIDSFHQEDVVAKLRRVLRIWNDKAALCHKCGPPAPSHPVGMCIPMYHFASSDGETAIRNAIEVDASTNDFQPFAGTSKPAV